MALPAGVGALLVANRGLLCDQNLRPESLDVEAVQPLSLKLLRHEEDLVVMRAQLRVGLAADLRLGDQLLRDDLGADQSLSL